MALGISMAVLLIFGHPLLAGAAPGMGSSVDVCAAGAPGCDFPGESDGTHLLQRRMHTQESALDSAKKDVGTTSADLNQSHDSHDETYSKAGANLLRSKHGALAIKFMYAADRLTRYYLRTMYRTDQRLPEEYKDRPEEFEWEKPSKEKLAAIFTEWCDELAKKGEHCSKNPLEMEASMGYTRCLLEEATDAGELPTAIFAVLMETMGNTAEVVMPSFEEAFGELPHRELHACEGEQNPPEPRDVTRPPRQHSAVAAAAQVQQAAERHRQGSLLSSLGAAQVEDLWRGPCRSLRCDPASFMDVVRATHGLSAELVEVAAPARVIHDHFVTVRKVHILLQELPEPQDPSVAQNASSLSQSNADLETFANKEGLQQSTARLERVLKDGAGVLDTAFALLRGSSKMLTTWGWCLTINWLDQTAWTKKFPLPHGLGAMVSFSIERQKASLKDLLASLMRDGSVGCNLVSNFMPIEMKAGLFIGWSPSPTAKGVQAGIAAEFSSTVDSCKAFDANIKIGLQGAVLKGGKKCPPKEVKKLLPKAVKCIRMKGFVSSSHCCTFNFLTGTTDCDKWATQDVKDNPEEPNWD